MVEISTSSKTSVCKGKSHAGTNTEYPMENLSEEEQQFYSAIQEKLDKLKKEPHQATIKRVMDYSKSYTPNNSL